MAWTVEFDKNAKKQFKKLDKSIKEQIEKFIFKLQKSYSPKQFGEGLEGNFKGIWRYRVGNYRILCEIHNKIVTILIINIDHRREVYKTK